MMTIAYCTTTYHINDKEKGNNDAIEDQEMAPLLPQVGKYTCLTRLAIVAQPILLVAPCLAVGIRRARPGLRNLPIGCVLMCKPT